MNRIELVKKLSSVVDSLSVTHWSLQRVRDEIKDGQGDELGVDEASKAADRFFSAVDKVSAVETALISLVIQTGVADET